MKLVTLLDKMPWVPQREKEELLLAYETGSLSAEQTMELFDHLKKLQVLMKEQIDVANMTIELLQK